LRRPPTPNSGAGIRSDEIDERVEAFLGRPFEADRPYLWPDATDVEVRSGGRTVSIAVIIADAVMPSEAKTSWTGWSHAHWPGGGLRSAVDEPTREPAKAQWLKLIDAFEEPGGRLAKPMRQAEDGVQAFHTLPKVHRS
jgi:transposase-like protein